MAEFWRIHTKDQLAAFTEFMGNELANGKKHIVEVVKPVRSHEQNRLLHAMLNDVARQKGDETVEELKRYVKLHFGVPKLRESNEQFKLRYDKNIRHVLTYEQKLEAMDILDVTSQLNVAQMTELLNETEKHFAAQGVHFGH